MNKVIVLIEGYARETKNGWFASSTTTLIRSDDKNIIVDPGINRKKLITELKRQKLQVSDIDYVFMTHYHPDHNLLTGIFEDAKVLDDEMVYENDLQSTHAGKIPGTDIDILHTPGHDQFHGSLVVPTSEGNVLVAGDLFWWSDNEKQKTDRINLLSHKDPFVKDKKLLLESRKQVLKVADYIIPGHGKMFKINR